MAQKDPAKHKSLDKTIRSLIVSYAYILGPAGIGQDLFPAIYWHTDVTVREETFLPTGYIYICLSSSDSWGFTVFNSFDDVEVIDTFCNVRIWNVYFFVYDI